jgi:hypothetical protein
MGRNWAMFLPAVLHSVRVLAVGPRVIGIDGFLLVMAWPKFIVRLYPKHTANMLCRAPGYTTHDKEFSTNLIIKVNLLKLSNT